MTPRVCPGCGQRILPKDSTWSETVDGQSRTWHMACRLARAAAAS